MVLAVAQVVSEQDLALVLLLEQLTQLQWAPAELQVIWELKAATQFLAPLHLTAVVVGEGEISLPLRVVMAAPVGVVLTMLAALLAQEVLVILPLPFHLKVITEEQGLCREEALEVGVEHQRLVVHRLPLKQGTVAMEPHHPFQELL
jgi:hypothetical protein